MPLMSQVSSWAIWGVPDLGSLHRDQTKFSRSCANIKLLASLAAAHEECERLERIIVKDFDQDIKGHREKLAQGQRVRRRLDELQALSKKLVWLCNPSTQAFALTFFVLQMLCTNYLCSYTISLVQERIYADEDGARKEEIALLKGLDEHGFRSALSPLLCCWWRHVQAAVKGSNSHCGAAG